MAITPFGLAQALVESAGTHSPIIAAYEFGTDNLDECTADMNFRIMHESADLAEIIVSTDELLAEAAMTSPERVDVLHENVFKTIKEGVVKFFDKIISMVKGIIEKIKAYFYKMTGKTDKWVKIMEPKIQAAQRQPGYSDFSVECYRWNADYLSANGELATNVGKLVDDWREKVQDKDKNAKKLSDEATKIPTEAAAYKSTKKNPVDADSDKVKKYVIEVEGSIRSHKTDRENFEKNFAKTVASIMGVGSASSIDVVWAEITKKAQGGTEKVETKVGGDAGKMLNVVKESGKSVEAIKKVYEKHLKDLIDYKATLEKIGSEMTIKDEDKYPSEVVRVLREAFKAHYDLIMKQTTMYETTANSARQLHTNLVQSMTSDYMTILTKFAGYKGNK